jgi:hypothetical protein
LNETASQAMDTYVRTGDLYYNNAIELAGKEEIRKATELLWGAVTQDIKALAAVRGNFLRTHNEIRTYVRQIGSDADDAKLYEEFLDLQALHRNFYDKEIQDEDFVIYLRKTDSFRRKIRDLIEVASDR